MKQFLKMLALLLLLAVSAPTFSMVSTIRGTVLSVSPRPADSGWNANYVEVLVANESGPVPILVNDKDIEFSYMVVGEDKSIPLRLFILFMTQDQPLPKAGATCTFTAHITNIGRGGSADRQVDNAIEVDNFLCSEYS